MDATREPARYLRPVWLQDDELRPVVPPFAVIAAILAATTDPSSLLDVVLIATPAVLLTVWALARKLPFALELISLAVIVASVAAVRHGTHELILFEVSLLAFIVGRVPDSLKTALSLGLLAVAAPVAAHELETRGDIKIAPWMLGIALPWLIGRALHRQAQLAAQLELTRRQLAEQAILEERRRIARDVHDFVGHGLAAAMLQITSARHVLRRDPDAAEEALRTAEEVGRRSMQELRRNLALLRSESDGEGLPSGPAPPVPTAAEIDTLVRDARTAGLRIDADIDSAVSSIPDSVGLAMYRIAQETLANAARHAPNAHTTLNLTVTDGEARLTVDSTGPVDSTVATDPERQRYGLIGMRERATALGGTLAAGPTPEGWQVSCTLPLEPAQR